MGLLSVLVPVSPLRASKPMPAENWKAVLERWAADLEEARDLLEQGKYRKVRNLMDGQLSEMAQRFRTGDIAAKFLGTGSALRAIAHAGLGDLEDAAWDWGVARSLVPEIDELDRSPFGAAGAFPESEEYKALFGELAGLGPDDARAATDKREVPANIAPPRKLRAPAPWYPVGKRDACVEEPLVILAVIGRDGRPYAPSLVSSGDPVLFFNAAETLRTWRFAPARRDGEPVPVFYNLTVNYKTIFCDTRFEGR